MATDKSFVGKGVLFIENDDGVLVDIGNTTAFSYSAEEENIELKNYRTAGGGNRNSITRVTAVNLQLDVSDFSGQNLAFGLFGSVTAVAAGAVSGEAQTTPADVSLDQLLPTDHVIDTDETVTVTGYTEGTDFEVRAAGLVILASGSIPASTALSINYTKKAVDLVQAFVNAAQDRKIVLDGLNEAQNGSPVVITIYRAKFGPAQETAFIGDEFGSISLSGEALIDTTITSSGVSQYLKIAAA